MAIVNAASLERNLYLVAELLALPLPLVIGLNMLDVAEQHGIHVEPHVLAGGARRAGGAAGGRRNQGLRELVDAARQAGGSIRTRFSPTGPTIRPEHAPVLGSRSRPARRPRCRRPIPPTGWPSSCWRATPRSRPWCAPQLPRSDGTRLHASAAAARGCLPRHRRRPLRLDRPHGARGGRPARAGAITAHRPHRPGGHPSVLGAGCSCWRCSASSSG